MLVGSLWGCQRLMLVSFCQFSSADQNNNLQHSMRSEGEKNSGKIPNSFEKTNNLQGREYQMMLEWSSGGFKQSFGTPQKSWHDTSRSGEGGWDLGNFSNSFPDRRSFQMEESEVIKIQPELLQRKFFKTLKQQEKQSKPSHQSQSIKQNFVNYGYRFYKSSFYDLLYAIIGIYSHHYRLIARDAFLHLKKSTHKKNATNRIATLLIKESRKLKEQAWKIIKENKIAYGYQHFQGQRLETISNRNFYNQKQAVFSGYKPQGGIQGTSKHSDAQFQQVFNQVQHKNQQRINKLDIDKEYKEQSEENSQESFIFPSQQKLQSMLEEPFILRLRSQEEPPRKMYHLNPDQLIDCIADPSLHFPIDEKMHWIGKLEEMNTFQIMDRKKKKYQQISTTDNLKGSSQQIRSANFESSTQIGKIGSFQDKIHKVSEQYYYHRSPNSELSKKEEEASLLNRNPISREKNQYFTSINNNPGSQLKAAMNRNKSIVIKKRPKSLTNVHFSYGVDGSRSPNNSSLRPNFLSEIHTTQSITTGSFLPQQSRNKDIRSASMRTHKIISRYEVTPSKIIIRNTNVNPSNQYFYHINHNPYSQYTPTIPHNYDSSRKQLPHQTSPKHILRTPQKGHIPSPYMESGRMPPPALHSPHNIHSSVRPTSNNNFF